MNERRRNVLRMRARSLFRRAKVERELEKELRFHLDQEIEEGLARGLPLEEARIAALRKLGGMTQIQEECRDMRETNVLESLIQDVRYALRMLIKTQGFTIAMVFEGNPLHPRFDENRFGGNFGGPIKHDKLFFFVDYEYNPIGGTSSTY